MGYTEEGRKKREIGDKEDKNKGTGKGKEKEETEHRKLED